MSKADLQAALAKSAGSTRHRIDDSVKAEQNPEKEQTYSQPSRKYQAGDWALSKQVRDELKTSDWAKYNLAKSYGGSL